MKTALTNTIFVLSGLFTAVQAQAHPVVSCDVQHFMKSGEIKKEILSGASFDKPLKLDKAFEIGKTAVEVRVSYLEQTEAAQGILNISYFLPASKLRFVATSNSDGARQTARLLILSPEFISPDLQVIRVECNKYDGW